ncbi:MAG: 30S ribosomal protein S21 [Elusimicrobia bacterium]|nr:30S ribosomal protein S21 [Elusimicrobiota bacterium]
MASGPIVRKKEHETVNSLLKRFRRECNKAGLKNELKKRRFHVPPSEIKNINNSKEKRRKLKDRLKEISREKRVRTNKRRG